MKKLILFLSFFSVPLMSCSTILNYVPYVYRIDVNQGNVIDQVMVDQLRPNMSKRQVLYIMGSPMLIDFFHQNRWDYVYSAKKGGEDAEQKTVSIFFENDQIKGIQGDLKPNNLPSVVKTSSDNMVDVPKRDLEKTLTEKITDLSSLFGTNNDAKKEVEPLKQPAVISQ